ncbi:MAG: amidohydrolase family protein [Bacteroidota bacterium]|nr:amidohydrolase family protein [Bacteroidota bacterium]
MRTALITSIFFFYSICVFAQFVDTSYYSVVKSGTISGEQKAWQTSPDQFNYTYYYNDRGRGDSLSAAIQTNKEGLIVSLNINGVDYYKNPYSESFEIIGDSAVWTINGDRKAKKFDNQFYYSYLIPSINELEINWLMKQPGRKGNVLPESFIHADEPVSKSISYDGRSAVLNLYSIYFDTLPAPWYVWMTDKGHLFALVNSWFSIIEEGYETWADTLNAIQELAGQKYFLNQMKEFSENLPAHILITHANIFQSADASLLEDMTVEVLNGDIADIYPASENKITEADTIINAAGKFLMPGLWDMHGHYYKEAGVWYLSGGVTHVRDMGNSKILLTYKEEIANNNMLGPDISYISGFIDKIDPYQGPTGKMVGSIEEAIKAIDEYKQLGYDQIKIYSSIKPEWVPAMAEHAHTLGMRICGHIPSFMTGEQAIRDGYNEMTHMNFVFLNFMGDTIDTRTPLRFRLVGDNAGKIDLQSKEVQSFISLMKEKSITLDATLNIFGGMFNEFKGDTSASLKPVISWLPDYLLTELANQTPFGSEDNKPDYQSAFANMKKMLKLLYDNGILLVAGTDGGEAIGLHHELEIYVEAGIPANEVLKIATYNAALNCNLQNKYGEIKTGRTADLILIDGNPMNNISDIRRVELVIKNNKIYNPKQLLASQGWKYYY